MTTTCGAFSVWIPRFAFCCTTSCLVLSLLLSSATHFKHHKRGELFEESCTYLLYEAHSLKYCSLFHISTTFINGALICFVYDLCDGILCTTWSLWNAILRVWLFRNFFQADIVVITLAEFDFSNQIHPHATLLDLSEMSFFFVLRRQRLCRDS